MISDGYKAIICYLGEIDAGDLMLVYEVIMVSGEYSIGSRYAEDIIFLECWRVS